MGVSPSNFYQLLLETWRYSEEYLELPWPCHDHDHLIRRVYFTRICWPFFEKAAKNAKNAQAFLGKSDEEIAHKKREKEKLEEKKERIFFLSLITYLQSSANVFSAGVGRHYKVLSLLEPLHLLSEEDDLELANELSKSKSKPTLLILTYLPQIWLQRGPLPCTPHR